MTFRDWVKKICIVVTCVGLGCGAVVHSSYARTATWPFERPWGQYDIAQLKRGLEVYRQVCSSCHSLRYLSTAQLSLLGLTDESLRTWGKQAIETFQEQIKNRLVSPTYLQRFPFAEALISEPMKAPDLSLLALGRARVGGDTAPLSFLWDTAGGAPYIYNLLLGYQAPPEGMEHPGHLYYNPAFVKGDWVAMPEVLAPGVVDYQGEAKETVEQYAQDVAAFLVWVADPHKKDRVRLGTIVLIVLALFSFLFYLRLCYIKRHKLYKDHLDADNC